MFNVINLFVTFTFDMHPKMCMMDIREFSEESPAKQARYDVDINLCQYLSKKKKKEEDERKSGAETICS